MIINPQSLKEIASEMAERLEQGKYRQVVVLSRQLSPSRTAFVLSGTEPEEAGRCLIEMDKSRAGRVLSRMPTDFAVSVLETLPYPIRVKIVNNIPADNIIAILESLDEEEEKELTGHLDRKIQEHIKDIKNYPEDSAGRLMSPYYVSVEGKRTVSETLESILSAPPEIERTPYVYVLDDRNKAAGVISIKDLLRTEKTRPVKDVMSPSLVTVSVTDSAHQAAIIIRNRKLMMLPIVDGEGYIAGVITFDDAMRVLSSESAQLITSHSAVAAEESFFTPPVKAVKGRLPWMAANVFLNMGAVAVITGFEETIATVAILAAFIPMITDMGGNVGIQALSVAIRSIAMGEARLRDFRKVIRKEVVVGMMNGLALGILFAAIAFVMRGNPYLGIVAGAALGINVLVAGIVGGTLPFIVKSLGKDPAMMTGPVLTTITDITGVSIYLGLSTAFIAFLA